MLFEYFKYFLIIVCFIGAIIVIVEFKNASIYDEDTNTFMSEEYYNKKMKELKEKKEKEEDGN